MLYFYDVDTDYADYLRGIDDKIPYITYAGKDKFVCGVVLAVDGYDYFVPISSNKNKSQTDMLISDENGTPLSTLRFGYMFPAPTDILTEKDIGEIRSVDPAYAMLLQKEYEFCRKNEDDIRRKAEKVYKIGCNSKHFLNKQCCNFKILESGYRQYFESRMDEAGI